jgi:hypothetical protein
MAAPWEKYQNQAQDQTQEGPWSKYSTPDNSKQAAAPSQEAPSFMSNLANLQLGAAPSINNYRDIAQGVVAAIPKVQKFISQNVAPLLPKSIQNVPNPFVPSQAWANMNVDKTVSPIGSGNDDGEAQMFRGLGESLPALAGGGSSILAQGLLNTLQAASSANKGDQNLFGLLPDGKTGSAIETAVASLVPGGALKLFEKLRPSNVLRGTLTPDELARNLEQTKGTSTGLGPIIGSKKLKDELEIKAPQYFGTGANETMQNTAQQIQAQGKGLLDTMRGNTQPSKVPSALKDALSQAEADVNAVSKQKAGLLNTAADNAGIKVKDEALQQQANAILSDIGTNAKLARKVPDSIKEDLQYYANNPQENQSLKEADIFNPTLRDEGSKLYQGGDKYLGNIYKDLYEAARADVDKALDSATDKNVIKLRDDYRAHFGMEKKPFEDPDVAKFTKKGGDPDLFLKTFLKTGNTDRPIQLEKAMSKLPEDKKNLMAYAHYSPAINEHGVLDPRMIASLHGKLGTEQKAVLFKHAPELLKQMDNYAGLVGKNQKAFNTMFSPENGAKLAAFAPTASMAAGAGIGAKIAGVPGAIAGGALGLVGPSVKGRITTKLLTSEKLRTKLVNKMIENKKLFDRSSNVIPAQTLSQSLINSKRGNQ